MITFPNITNPADCSSLNAILMFLPVGSPQMVPVSAISMVNVGGTTSCFINLTGSILDTTLAPYADELAFYFNPLSQQIETRFWYFVLGLKYGYNQFFRTYKGDAHIS
jgi:hypothetical protein